MLSCLKGEFKGNDMKQITIDGNNFSDEEEFYAEIDRLLTKDLDWKTGHNLNALRDLLRGGFGVHEYGEELDITWINAAKSRRDLGYEETLRHWEKILETCHPSNASMVKDCISNAKDRTGKTLFDIIVDEILDSDDTGHRCKLTVKE